MATALFCASYMHFAPAPRVRRRLGIYRFAHITERTLHSQTPVLRQEFHRADLVGGREILEGGGGSS